MIENNITSVVLHNFRSRLKLVRQHFIKTLTLHIRRDDSSEILQCDLHRIIQSRHYHQEHKESKQIDLTPCEKHASDYSRRSYTKLQYYSRRVNIYSHLKLCEKCHLLDIFDLHIKFFHV